MENPTKKSAASKSVGFFIRHTAQTPTAAPVNPSTTVSAHSVISTALGDKNKDSPIRKRSPPSIPSNGRRLKTPHPNSIAAKLR